MHQEKGAVFPYVFLPFSILHNLDCQKGGGKRKLAYEDDSDEGTRASSTTRGSEPPSSPLQSKSKPPFNVFQHANLY